jgi:hypothetical protein
VIVTVTPTVMDGTVLRWYAADDDAGQHPVMSVSRNRVQVHEKDAVTPAAAQAAAEAHAALKRDRYANVLGYATHARVRPGRHLVPLKGGE